ncbi:MAG: C1 family peptidase [Bacteroidetes bacterium]|nr:C1 family peptidase [Bacteroidota bacterium]
MKKEILLVLLLAPMALWAQPTKRTGLLLSPAEDMKVNLVSKPIGFGDGLPKAVSLFQYAPSVKDQGDYGTCVGWSSTYYIATIELARHLGIDTKTQIDALAFDPFYTYLSIINNNDPSSYSTCEMGTYLTDACDFLYEQGPKPLNYKRLYCGDDLQTFQNSRFSRLKITDYYRVLDPEDDASENITSACQMIVRGHPVLCGMITTESLFKIGKDGLFKPTNKEKNDPEGNSYGGHALAIIGYDDNRFGGSFEIINSWGNEWGDQGKFYLKYSDFEAFVKSAFAIETELMDPSLTNGSPVFFGNTKSGYAAVGVLGTGVQEGQFLNGKLISGIYYNPTVSKKHLKLIKKNTKKKYNAEVISIRNDKGVMTKVGYIIK